MRTKRDQQRGGFLGRWAAILGVVVVGGGPVAFAAISVTHTYPAGWNIVTVPVTLTNPDPAAVFDELAAPRRIYDYRAGLEVAPGEPGFRNFPTGSGTGAAGYWVLFPQATNVEVTGDEPSRDVPYHTAIAPGWNVVGSPWRSSVPWSDARILVSDGATTKVLSEAVTAGWIQGKLRAWDDAAPGGGGYVELLANAGGSLPPWLGFEMYSTVTGALIFAPPPPDTTAPVVDIESPAEIAPTVPPTWPGDGHDVTKVTSVIGKVEDDNVASWTLTFRSLETDATITLATGNTDVPSGGFLGNLDPTLQLNGLGVLRLTAADVGGRQAIPDEELVVIGGDNKLGNFRLTFVDLEVPVAGIPITVRRTYDTRRRSANLDFGYGWQLEVFAAGRYMVNRDPGDGWEFSGGTWGCDVASPSRNHVMEIRFSDREFYRFALDARAPAGGSADCLAKGKFVQVGGIPGAKLEDNNYPLAQFPAGVPLISDGGDQLIEELDPGGTYLPRDVRLTTLDGRKLDLMFTAGTDAEGTSRPRGFYRMTDRNGNVLELLAGGQVKWSNMNQPGVAKTIQINRTAGRVTSIIDPAGIPIPYGYDGAGNLTAVTDRTANTTSFLYDPSHFLTAIKDPLQNFPIRPEFDATGRLTAWRDADGNATTFQTDVANNQVSVTNREGASSTYFYGDDGYLKEAVEAGATLSYLYDARGNVTRTTNPLGNATKYEYNENDRPTQVTDALGQVTQYFYEAPTHADKITKLVQPLGNTTEFYYDTRGNLTREKDPTGSVQDATFNALGKPASESLPRDPALPATCVTSYLYDVEGNITSILDAAGTATDYEYDAANRQTKELLRRTPAPGQQPVQEVIATAFDAHGRLTKRTDALNYDTTFFYDAAGRRTQTVSASGEALRFAYDPRNRVTKRMDADGNFELSVYDLEGRRTTAQDRQGRITSYSYDEQGRLTSVVHPDLARDLAFYDAAGHRTKVVDPRGFATTFQYDPTGRLTQVMDPLTPAGVARSTYDANGRLTKVIDQNSHETSFFYDGAGRRTKTMFSDSTTDSMLYDAAGRLTKRLDQNGEPTAFEYDCLRRLVAVTTSMGNAWRYSYDEVNNLTALTDANLHTTEMRYGPQGRLANRILPLGQIESRTYDANGNLAARTDFNGETVSFLYDELDRLTRVVYPPGNGTTADVSYSYTPAGRRQAMHDGTGTTSYEYDDRDRMTKLTDSFGRSISYAYDPSGNRTALSTPGGFSIYAYDGANRLTKVSEGAGDYVYQYDPVGLRTRLAFPNGVVSTYEADALNRVTTIEHRKSSGELLASFRYRLDGVGNKTAVDEESELGVRHAEWSYDDEHKLTAETVTGSGEQARSLEFAYDHVGNRTRRRDQGMDTQLVEYDANDRVYELNGETPLYDANGNTLADHRGVYAWDLENRAIAITRSDVEVLNKYDGDGVRRSSVAGGIAREYVVDPTARHYRVLEERSPLDALIVSYMYGDSLLKQSRGPSFYHADLVGSTRVMTDVGQSAVNRYAFDAFGSIMQSAENTVNSYRFAAEESLAPELYNLRARHLETDLGRFLSRDPVGLSYGAARAPLYLNSYLYGNGNPVTYGDPSGLFADIAIAGPADLVGIGGTLDMSVDSPDGAGCQCGRDIDALIQYAGTTPAKMTRVVNHVVRKVMKACLATTTFAGRWAMADKAAVDWAGENIRPESDDGGYILGLTWVGVAGPLDGSRPPEVVYGGTSVTAWIFEGFKSSYNTSHHELIATLAHERYHQAGNPSCAGGPIDPDGVCHEIGDSWGVEAVGAFDRAVRQRGNPCEKGCHE